jgi:hypothetical protein
VSQTEDLTSLEDSNESDLPEFDLQTSHQSRPQNLETTTPEVAQKPGSCPVLNLLDYDLEDFATESQVQTEATSDVSISLYLRHKL